MNILLGLARHAGAYSISGLLVSGAYLYGHYRGDDAGYARRDYEVAAERQAADAEQRRIERFSFETYTKAQNAKAQTLHRANADAADARSAADKLRDDLAAIISVRGQSATSGADCACPDAGLLKAMADDIARLADSGAAIANAADIHIADSVACVAAWP